MPLPCGPSRVRRCDHEFPDSADVLRTLEGKIIQIEAGELAKVDGALTCCSLLLTPTGRT